VCNPTDIHCLGIFKSAALGRTVLIRTGAQIQVHCIRRILHSAKWHGDSSKEALIATTTRHMNRLTRALHDAHKEQIGCTLNASRYALFSSSVHREYCRLAIFQIKKMSFRAIVSVGETLHVYSLQRDRDRPRKFVSDRWTACRNLNIITSSQIKPAFPLTFKNSVIWALNDLLIL